MTAGSPRLRNDESIRRLSSTRLAASARYRSGLLVQFVKRMLNNVLSFWLSHSRGKNIVSAFLRRGIWKLSRSYRPTTPPRSRKFDDLVSRIAIGGLVTPDELLPFLSVEGKAQRAEVNAMLAEAYSRSSTEQNLRLAQVFVQRAWLLSDFSADLLALYTKINSACSDTASIREAFKRLGMKAAARGCISEALSYFTQSQYAYLAFDHLDKYDYDFDVLSCIDALAAPHRFYEACAAVPYEGEKIRIAYLMKGILEINSNLIQINLELARFHDKSRFDFAHFVPESQPMIAGSPQGNDYLAMFKDLGYEVILGPNVPDRAERLLGLARKVHDARPHILVMSAALADAEHYFITSLRPAPIVIGLIQGPTQQFTPPTLDWGIVWSRHPLIDSPVNCSHVRLMLDWPINKDVTPYSRSDLGLSEDACVLLSGGRFPKFQEPAFWRAIANVLAVHPSAVYLAVGVSAEQVPFLNEVVPSGIKPRVRCLGWRKDFLRILSAADVVIDTYPSGGGQVIVQAMSAGIPVVAHCNDYMRLYDQTDWSPAEDFISDPEVLIPRGDFKRFDEVMNRLIEDETYRLEVGKRGLMQQRGQANPERAARDCEAVYAKVLRQFSASHER